MSSLDLASYNITSNGFLPDKLVSCFSDPYYKQWDKIINSLPKLISSKELFSQIKKLDLLVTDCLVSEAEYQRAYVVLGFIIHGYVWSGTPPRREIPPQLSEPFLKVCKYIGTEPVLSYSGLCLWNWISKNDDAPHDLESLQSVASFTGTRGEDAFYHVPVLVEVEGARIIPLLLDALSQPDPGIMTEALLHTSKALVRMSSHLSKLYSTLDANFFYNTLRPYFSGSSSLPDGIVFVLQDGTRQAKCIGGSAAQSSLFPFLDIVLGVKHTENSFFQQMRAYMPSKHRAFLEAVSNMPSIRGYIQTHEGDKNLSDAYDACLEQLKLWRGKHIAVVSKYIVQPARAADGADGGDLQGTGGSALIPFLRQARDDTVGIGK